jgi:aminopeptidase N
LAQLEPVLDAPAFLKAYLLMKKGFAQASQSQLLEIYETFHGKNVTSLDPKDFDRRHLKNRALSYLISLPPFQELAKRQFETAQTMTDQQAAFAHMVDFENDMRDFAIDGFYQHWKSESLVLNKWFALQASSLHPKTFETVQKLMSHPDFQIKNPNRVFSLIRTFGDNLAQFHRPDQDTYAFMADRVIEVDKLNPQTAARLAASFDVWTKLPTLNRNKAHRELERMIRSGLSSNTHEIVQKALMAGEPLQSNGQSADLMI